VQGMNVCCLVPVPLGHSRAASRHAEERKHTYLRGALTKDTIADGKLLIERPGGLLGLRGSGKSDPTRV
jgi:hypothetical protein